MKVSKIMHKIIVVDKNITLKEAAKIMSKKKIGSLILIEDDEIKGILTERDVLKNVENLNKKISFVMNKKIICVDSSDEIEDAAEIMAKCKIKRLPVLEKGKLSGIITATDIIANTENFESF